MADLKRLIEWNENQAPRCWYSGDSDNHRETARILRTLADVQRECDFGPLRELNDGKPDVLCLDFTGPAEPLRALAELLEKPE